MYVIYGFLLCAKVLHNLQLDNLYVRIFYRKELFAKKLRIFANI